MTPKEREELGWNDSDGCECMAPLPHSHDFTLRNNSNKICPECNILMDSKQVMNRPFGKNELIFGNAYTCLSCNHNEEEIFYNGTSIPNATLVSTIKLLA